jgi:hypothetical protein
MWIDHCFFGRPLTRIDQAEVQWKDGIFSVKVKTSGETEIKKVKCYYFQTDEPRFLELGHGRHFKNVEHFTNADLKSFLMERNSGKYTAKVNIPADQGKYLACFIQAEDDAGQTSGFSGTRYFWIEFAKSIP